VEAFIVAVQQSNPDKAAWSVKSWCADLDLSPAYAYELMAAGKVASVKVGGKRLITTAPRDFIAQCDAP
jgi:hypothetical protein